MSAFEQVSHSYTLGGSCNAHDDLSGIKLLKGVPIEILRKMTIVKKRDHPSEQP